MILLFEGIDCVGKTTLINRLIREQDDKIICYDKKIVLLERLRNVNVSPSNRTYETDKFSIMTELTYLKALHNKMNLALDRLHFSHYVYAFTRRGYKLDFIKNIDEVLSELNIKLFFITADFDIVKERLIKEGDNLSLKNIEKEYNLMFKMYNRTLIKDKYIIKNNCYNDINNNIDKIGNLIK